MEPSAALWAVGAYAVMGAYFAFCSRHLLVAQLPKEDSAAISRRKPSSKPHTDTFQEGPQPKAGPSSGSPADLLTGHYRPAENPLLVKGAHGARDSP